MALINAENMMRQLMSQMNEEMQKAAEPVIRKAVEEAEREMRRRLGAMFISLLEGQFSMERFGTDLRIIVKHEGP